MESILSELPEWVTSAWLILGAVVTGVSVILAPIARRTATPWDNRLLKLLERFSLIAFKGKDMAVLVALAAALSVAGCAVEASAEVGGVLQGTTVDSHVGLSRAGDADATRVIEDAIRDNQGNLLRLQSFPDLPRPIARIWIVEGPFRGRTVDLGSAGCVVRDWSQRWCEETLPE